MSEPKLVSYYLDGWRTGWLHSTNGFQSVVVPIRAKGQTGKSITVPADDVKEIEPNGP